MKVAMNEALALEALESSMKASCQLIVQSPFCSGQRLLNDIATSKSPHFYLITMASSLTAQ